MGTAPFPTTFPLPVMDAADFPFKSVVSLKPLIEAWRAVADANDNNVRAWKANPTPITRSCSQTSRPGSPAASWPAFYRARVAPPSSSHCAE